VCKIRAAAATVASSTTVKAKKKNNLHGQQFTKGNLEIRATKQEMAAAD